MKIRLLKPVFFENSRLPVILSKVSPINIWAFSFGFWVWCRGEMDERVRTHETIHFQQQLEMLFIFQWILYGLFWLVGMIKYRDGEVAYMRNPFEQEAYENDENQFYMITRKTWAWRKFKI